MISKFFQRSDKSDPIGCYQALQLAIQTDIYCSIDLKSYLILAIGLHFLDFYEERPPIISDYSNNIGII